MRALESLGEAWAHLRQAVRFLDGQRRYRRFIILARGRSGSNLLRGLLNAHSRIVVFGELFRDPDAIGWEFPDYERLCQDLRLVALMQRDPARFLEQEVFRRFPRSIAAVGFKLFYYHAREGSRSGLWPYLREQTDLRVVHLKRRNTLKVLLSEKRAFQTNRWTNTTGEPEERFATALAYEECLHAFTRAREEHCHGDLYFRDHEQLEVVYENLVADYAPEIRRVQEFLGVEHETVRPSTYRQSTQRLAESIANYGELAARFRGTPWAEFFEE